MRSANVDYAGYKILAFPDGQKIKSTLGKDVYYGMFMGTFGSQIAGKSIFTDEGNELVATVNYGSYYLKKQDFFSGEIKKAGKKVCEISGNYMGYIDFDGQRYWDYRDESRVHFPVIECKDTLPSQSTKRTDGIFLRTKTVEEAQAEKERLEEL